MSDDDLIRRGDAMRISAGAVTPGCSVPTRDLIAALPSQDARIRGEVIEAAKAAAIANSTVTTIRSVFGGGTEEVETVSETIDYILAAIDALHTPESRAAVKGGKP